MAATGPAPSSSKQQPWWTRSTTTHKPPSPALLKTDTATLYAAPRSPPMMTPVTTPKAMSNNNTFTMSSAKSSSSRFNFASVLPSFASKSRKHQPVDIQDPPAHIRSLPTPKSSSSRHHFPVSSPSSSSTMSRRVASSRASSSTDGPLTPSDELGPTTRGSYQQSIMTLTDLSDPFASESPLNDRRASTHSDKSIGRRLMSKVEGKPKTTSRLPVGDGHKRKSSRDRSATLPSRVRSATDASDAYLPLRAVEPPWQPSSPPQSPESPLRISPLHATVDYNVRPGTSSPMMPRKPKTSKTSLPWPESHAESSSLHRHDSWSSSLTKERSNSSRASVNSTGIPLPLSPTSPLHESRTSTPMSASMRPPRPPPTQELPPTPGSASLRVRADTIAASASASAISFASSLSSLSFTSRPSPQDAAPPQNYPSLLAEALPSDVIRRGSDSGSSQASGRSAGAGWSQGRTLRPFVEEPAMRPHTADTPKPVKHLFSGSRPLPSPPVVRERALSTTSSIGDDTHSIRTLRKQRSFHNTSVSAPAQRVPTLRHYNSFEPVRSPAPPPNTLPPLPPPQSPPPTKRTLSAGKDSVTSPRRKLFSSHKHDREKERKQEQEAAAATPTASPPLHHSSSWYTEEANMAPAEPPVVTQQVFPDVAQHIVPPAELLRLGAAWEREGEQKAARAAARSHPPPRSAGNLETGVPAWGSRLPRSVSLLSKASSAPDSLPPPESYTSLSPPPRRARLAPSTPTRRTMSNATPPGSGMGNGTAKKAKSGARVERKPSFLDMTTQRSVSIELPEQRDSFLELSRGVDSIDTIRESDASFQ